MLVLCTKKLWFMQRNTPMCINPVSESSGHPCPTILMHGYSSLYVVMQGKMEKVNWKVTCCHPIPAACTPFTSHLPTGYHTLSHFSFYNLTSLNTLSPHKTSKKLFPAPLANQPALHPRKSSSPHRPLHLHLSRRHPFESQWRIVCYWQ